MSSLTAIASRLCAVVLALAPCGCHADQLHDNYRKPAHFRVLDEPVRRGVEPFAATIGGFGNSVIGSGFEPQVYRNQYVAEESARDTVAVNPKYLTHYDTLKEGFLDGGEARVYRIENGRFRMVRASRIPEGGFVASGWTRVQDDRTVVSASATHFDFKWDGWNRPGAEYYFTVRSIDYSGNLSRPATAVSAVRPEKLGDTTPANRTEAFRPSRLTFDTTPPPSPTNLTADVDRNGTLRLQWDPVEARDLAGYVVYVSDYPPEAQHGFYIKLSPQASSAGQQIRAGDLVVVSKKFYTASRKLFHTNRVWGARNETGLLLPDLVDFFPDEDPRRTWELVRHKPDTPVEQPGETYLKLELKTTNPQAIYAYNHSGIDQDWYPVLETKPYKVEVWLRSERPGKVQFRLTGYYDQPGHRVEPITFRVGPTWRKYAATFTPPAVQKGKQPNQMALVFDGPNTYDVDNFRVYRADAAYLDFTPEEYGMLKDSAVSALRTHAFVRTRFRTYDMDQLTNPGGVANGTVNLDTLPQTLAMMKRLGVRPWLQIEPHMSPDEWLGLAEYLAAPYDPAVDRPQAKPWAYKRYLQGRQSPWTEAFDRIYLELGNETWNALFSPWTFGEMTDSATGERYSPGQVYGLYQEYVAGILKHSPYWHAAGLDGKLKFVLGGWSGLEYGKDAAAVSPSSDYMTIAAYNGGWDEGEGPPSLDGASFFNVLNQVSQVAIPVADKHLAEAAAIDGKAHRTLRVGTYEAGPGYVMNGLNGEKVTPEQAAAQEQVMKSQAAGTATIDSFLSRAYRGFELQNFFGFLAGPLWASHAEWYKGGQAYPSWKQIALFDNQATGDMLRTETLGVPTWDLKGFSRRPSVENAPLAAAYATRKGDRYNVYVVSRKMPDYPVAGDDGYTPTTIELPFGKARSITLYRMAGDPRANNVASDEVKIEKLGIPLGGFSRHFRLTAATGADNRGLPPAATLLYVFEGCSGFDRR